MTSRHPNSRRPRIATIALSLCMLVAALLGPSQTLAQTHKAACAAAHGKAARACPQSSHKNKHKPHHTSKSSAKHKPAKTKGKGKNGSSSPVILVPALCENGDKPVREGTNGFACEDGSEPSCEGGVAPTTSRNGKTLLCAVPAEPETSAAEGEGQGECEEEESLSCSPVSESDTVEKVCEVSPGSDSSFTCEGER